MEKLIPWVNKFFAVDNGGSCLPGPYRPFAIARPGPDCPPPNAQTGYRTGAPIIRFSHTHVSGTGGQGRYGNIGITPFIGELTTSIAPYTAEEEEAGVGFYKVRLSPQNIIAELTSTHKATLHRYQFPAGEKAGLFIDAGACISDQGEPGQGQAVSVGGFVEIISDYEVVGRGDCKGGWGHDFPYSVYFYAKFNLPAQERIVANPGEIQKGMLASGPNSQARLLFGIAARLEISVGVSYVSIANAREAVEREVADKSFEQVVTESNAEWEKELSRIKVSGGTDERRQLFYSFFARLLCMPSDLGIDDENPCWKSGIRHFTDYYCLWDSVRNANSFFGLFNPRLEVDMLNCLLDVASHTGWIPDAWIAGHSAFMQGGSSADVLFAESGLKGLVGINYEKALLQSRKNNEVESPNPVLCGRYLNHYRDLGYVSTDSPHCVSRHIEYSYQDYCIAKLANHLGQKEVAHTYLESSRKIWNLWRDDLKCFAPKTPEGGWVDPFDPLKPTRPDYWSDPYYYEGIAHEYSLCALHAIYGIIERHGGPPKFVQHLDRFFASYMYGWKEIILHTPYLYHYAGRPDKSADRIRERMSIYRPTRSGLPENEDMGSHSAFYMCSAMGFYPIMGQDFYLLSTPCFEQSVTALGESGKTLTINAPMAGTEKGLYITGARLNGKEIRRAFVKHAEIASGAVIDLTLAEKPDIFGTTELPPQAL